LQISDTSAQDVRIEPPPPYRRRILAGGAAVIIIASLVLVAPSAERWANATVSVPYDRIRTATVTRGDLVRDVPCRAEWWLP